MKKILVSAALVFSISTFAQQFGAKAGLNVSSISTKNTLENIKSRVGFNVGLYMNFPISEKFSFQPELIYTQYGSKSTFEIIGGNPSYSQSLSLDFTDTYNFIAVPLALQYKISPKFYAETGAEVGFLISGKSKGRSILVETFGNSSKTTVEDFDRDIASELNKINLGVMLGAGYYVTEKLGVNARYVAGVTDIAKNRMGDSEKAYHNVFQVGVTYRFK